MTDQEIQHTLEELAKEQEEAAAKESEANAQGMVDQEGVSQDGKDKDMDREQQGKDADAARDEGGKEADHDRAKELNKAQKENVNSKIIDTLNKLKIKVINESEDTGTKLATLDRILLRNLGNHQNKG